MSEIRGFLAGVGVSATFRVTEPATIRYYLTGTFSATVYLQRSTTPDETAWETIHSGGGPFQGGGDVAGQLTVTSSDSLRWYMSAYTSGSAFYLLTDEDAASTDPNATTEDTDEAAQTTNDLLTDILVELRAGNFMVNEVTDANVNLDDVRSAELDEI